MTQYIIRRVLQMIPIAFGILTLVFSLIHLIPGDPAVQIAGEGARPEDVVAIRKALGLDQPLWAQYVGYLRSEEHRLNSSHLVISYAVFCLKKKNKRHP